MSGITIAAGASGSSATLRVDTATYYAESINPANATVTYSVGSNGTVSISETGSIGESFPWLAGGNASNYEVRFTVTSGTLTSGTTGTWQALSSARSMSITSTVGTKTTVVTVDIGSLGTSTALKTGTATLSATKGAP